MIFVVLGLSASKPFNFGRMFTRLREQSVLDTFFAERRKTALERVRSNQRVTWHEVRLSRCS